MPRTTRWLPRWTIRTLLVVMAVIAVPLAWIGESVRRVRHRVAVARAFNEAGAKARHAEIERLAEEIEPLWDEILIGNWRSVDAVEFSAEPPSSVHDDLFQQIRCFPNLESVWLRGQPVTDRGLESLRGMVQLGDLSIEACNISDATMQIVASLTNLSELRLRAVPITDSGLQQIRSLPKLTSLTVHFTRVSPAAIENLRRAMPDCEIDYIPATPDQVTAACNLISRNNHLFDDRDVDGLSVIADGKLRLMRADDWENLTAFPTIRTVSLWDVDSVADALVHLRRLPNLRSVLLSRSPVSQDDVRQLATFGALTHLSIDSPGLGDGHLVELGSIKNLEWLRITSKSATNSTVGVEAITGLTNLRDLGLVNVNVDDRDMKLLTRLAELEQLDLTDTSVGDEGLESILALPKLRRLYLHRTRISLDGAARVMATPSITHAAWLGTGITPETYSRPTKSIGKP
jgi:Leucine-rich repeat (LRR) protein